MKKEQVLELMNAVPHDLIEEADLQAPAKRRIPKLARIGLIAACLCLALIGSAAAIRYTGVLSHVENDTILFSGGYALHPYDCLSDEIKAREGAAILQAFGSWQEIEDFIGYDLMDHPLLEGDPQTIPLTLTRGDEKAQGGYLVEADADLARIYAWANYKLDGTNIVLRASFYTDRVQEELGPYLGSYLNESTESSLELYTTPGGLDVQIVTTCTSTGFCHRTAVFAIDGIVFDTTSAGPAERADDALAALKQVLDGFVLSE